MSKTEASNHVSSGAFGDLLNSLSLQAPRYIEESAWLEHGPFAAWVIEAVKPRVLVELGTHGGFSYFAFCQAVAALNIPTKCYAVDHWRGDEHAGFYGNEIYERVNGHNASNYSSFSRLVRSSFDDALEHFSDGTVDLLHIDGRHFYDDVKHDFESWEPKLSDRAVVLFHDVNVRERDFGVYRLWEELTAKYPSFDFAHGHGLGVLGYGPKIAPQMKTLFDASGDEAQVKAIREAYGRLGQSISQQYAHRVEREKFSSELSRLGATQSNALASYSDLLARVKKSEKQVKRMQSSRSWQLTAPLRAPNSFARRVARLLKRVIKRSGRPAAGRRPKTASSSGAGDRGSGPKHRAPSAQRHAPAQIGSKERRAIRDAELASSRERLLASVESRLADPQAFRAALAEFAATRLRSSREVVSPRVVVYSAIVGGYDTLNIPGHLDSRYDYVLFTDRPVTDTGVFDVRPITYWSEDPVRMARWVKTHPHLLFPDHDIAIWLDANVMIVEDISSIVDGFVESGELVGSIQHPRRDSVYDEFSECIALNKDDRDALREQEAFYRASGFDCTRLVETNLMLMQIKDPRVASFFDHWWAQLDRFSRRDQLSVGYAAAAAGLEVHEVMERPQNLRNHPKFAYVNHGDHAELPSQLLAATGKPYVDPYQGDTYDTVRDARVASHATTRIDVIVCVHNALEDVEQCLESVEAALAPGHRLIVVNDGSDAPTSSFLDGFVADRPWASLVTNEQRKGYTKSANIGLKASTGELAILLNSDTVVSAGWAEKMYDALAVTPGAGIVGPLSNAASSQSLPDHLSSGGQTAINALPDGFTASDMDRWCEQQTIVDLLPRVALVHGFCFGVTRAALETIGYLDEARFPDGYGEEDDYCLRASNAGVGLVIATHTFVFHTKSKSYGSDKRATLVAAGAAALKESHGPERIRRAVRAGQVHHLLVRMRRAATRLYSSPPVEV